MSEYLLVLPPELPVQDSKINFNTEEKSYDANYTDSSLHQEHAVSIPGFSCIKSLQNYPEKLTNSDPSTVNRISGKRLLPYPEQNCTKLKRLETETAKLCEKLATGDILDSDQIQSIKNEGTLGATIDTRVIINSGGAHDTGSRRNLYDAENGCEINKMENRSTFSDDNLIGLKQMTSEKANNKNLQVNVGQTDSATVIGIENNGTEQNLINPGKPGNKLEQFIVSGTEANEYPSAYESVSFSHLFVNSTEFEPRLCLSTSVCTAKNKAANHHNVMISTVCAQSSSEIKNSNNTVQCLNQTSQCGNNNLVTEFETNVRQDSCEQPSDFQRLLNNLSPTNNSQSIGNVTTQNWGTVKIEVKQEVDSSVADMGHNQELLNNEENDFMDELAIKNWLASVVEQEEVFGSPHKIQKISGTVNAEDVSGVTAASQENNPYQNVLSSGLTQKQELNKDSALKSSARIQNEMVQKSYTSDFIHVGDIYADKTKNDIEDNFTSRFLQCLFPDVSTIPKTDESVDKERNLREDNVFTSLCASTSGNDTIADLSNIPQCSKKKTQSDNSIGATTSTQITGKECKHHKKVLLRKFSSSLEKEKIDENLNVLPVGIEQKETNRVDQMIPSTSTSVNDESLADECIVISDSEDSIIDLDIAQSRPRANKTKKSGGSTSNNLSVNTRRSKRLLAQLRLRMTGHQTQSSTSTVSDITECIVLSDDDDVDHDKVLQIASSPESPVCITDNSTRTFNNRVENNDIIDLSGVNRNQHDVLSNHNATNTEGDNSLDVNTLVNTLFDTIHTSSVPVTGMQRSQSLTHNSISDSTTSGYSNIEENFDWEIDDVIIDLSRRSFSPLSSDAENRRFHDGLNILALSDSYKEQSEENTLSGTRSRLTDEPSKESVKDDPDKNSVRTCPICLESLLSGQSVSTTPCGHLFCTSCIETSINRFKKCPTCCRKVLLKRVHKIFL